jgi:hypothetical protein
MSRQTMIGYIVAASSVAACGTVEDNASLNGVSREDAVAINHVMLADAPVHRIYKYTRFPDDMIIVTTDTGDYQVHRLHGKWHYGGPFVPDAPISY